ncbi:GDSL-type esterase/lipase family protein [Paraliobacillus zengyii]|uniref:DUF459 domain-containing protein n=1 Tax=Paraliobacillus zengyii TaxID=2213194 RepID=UPI001E3899C8|nr:GDSL-type esterase/lipase family protein [Paraliobacillus zengyii]
MKDTKIKKLVCFGDSITARHEGFDEPMLTVKLAAKLANYHVINAGISGNNTVDAINRLEADVLLREPDLVTVMFGANDAAFHKMIAIDTYQENLFKIVRTIGPKKTILITPSPVDESIQFARTNTVLATYAAVVRNVAEKTGAGYIALFSELLACEKYQQKLKGIRNDGLHFGEAGYDYLVDLIIKKLTEEYRWHQ